MQPLRRVEQLLLRLGEVRAERRVDGLLAAGAALRREADDPQQIDRRLDLRAVELRVVVVRTLRREQVTRRPDRQVADLRLQPLGALRVGVVLAATHRQLPHHARDVVVPRERAVGGDVAGAADAGASTECAGDVLDEREDLGGRRLAAERLRQREDVVVRLEHRRGRRAVL
ncbi:MAG: hypothetical protein K8T90_09275 [Planctomycetes bacterium]|nr:hypothetical protein [Planctomycetota bacterium]